MYHGEYFELPFELMLTTRYDPDDCDTDHILIESAVASSVYRSKRHRDVQEYLSSLSTLKDGNAFASPYITKI